MDRDRLKKETSLFLILFSVCVLMLSLHQVSFFRSLRAIIETPFLGLEAVFSDLYQQKQKISGFFLTRSEYQKELARLQKDLRQLSFEQVQLNTCLEENEKVRRLLGAPLPPSWKFLPAKVIGYNQDLKIDKGEDDGVLPGMMVLSDNILVGRVISSGKKSSLVQTVFDFAIKIPVAIKKPASGETDLVTAAGGIQAKGLLESQGGQLYVKEILQEEDVQDSDLVLTNGEAGWLPDLLVGQIQEVVGREAEVHKKATVLPLLDFDHLETIFVVTDW